MYEHDRLYSIVQTFMSGLSVQVSVELYCSISELMVEYKISHWLKHPVRIVKDKHNTK